jgi:NADPH-dependent 2,4-dienoyl-CoA reductase/sulfur reductase-like enzyme
VSSPESVLLVGASAAGLSTAEALRRLGYQGRLTLLAAEPRLPYDRPPLSKQVLAGSWEPSRAQLRTQAQWEALEAEFVRGEPAVALNVAERVVTTASGQVLHGDVLVIATGLTPRQLSGHGGHGGRDGRDGQGGVAGLAGVHVLRTLDDALALRAHLTASPHTRPTASLRVHPAGCADLAASAQAHGLPSPAAEVTIAEGDPEQRRFVAVYREAGEVTGVLGWNMPKQVRLLRQQFLRSWQTASPLTPA